MKTILRLVCSAVLCATLGACGITSGGDGGVTCDPKDKNACSGKPSACSADTKMCVTSSCSLTSDCSGTYGCDSSNSICYQNCGGSDRSPSNFACKLGYSCGTDLKCAKTM